MPYTINDQSKLPDNVKKLSPNKRRQWIHVWNSANKRTNDEGKAFAMANAAVAKKSKTVTLFDGPNDSGLPADIKSLSSSTRRSFISSYNYYAAQYADSDGALAYAYENTYIPLCDVLMYDKAKTSPYAADDEDEDEDDEKKPAKKELTEEEKKERDKSPREVPPRREPAQAKSFFANLMDGIKSVRGSKAATSTELVSASLTFYKNDSGKMRAMMVYSNQFKDHHKEIIPEAVHKEYVEWADRTGNYPEFHLWHCGPGSRWGKADFVDYVDGFAIMSGPVDEDKIHIAEALQKQKGLKVSHGFYGIKSADGTYLIYRPFEGCPLPGDAAANEWTAVSIGSEEFNMPFSKAKRDFLKSVGHTDAEIDSFEGGLKGLKDTLKEADIDFKEANTSDGSTNAGGTALAVDAAGMIMGELRALTDGVRQLAGVVVTKAKEQDTLKTGLEALIAESKKSIDERVETALTARVAGAVAGGGFRASEAGTTLTAEQAAKAKEANGGGDMSFFGSMIDAQFASVMGGAPIAQVGNGASTGGS